MPLNIANRPNVLLICADHWSGLHMGNAGHPSVITPTVDHLANLGVSFTNAYSACPVCIAARRSLMTGLSPRTHGDRCFNETLPMPDVPTLPQCFRNAGYQAFAVGKLHAYPVRSRLGFDEVLSNEEGRHHLGAGADDWEMCLAENGYFGQEYASGGCNNDYIIQPWHLPERLHPTNWTSTEMCRMIRRLDPSRPAFLYASFTAPHPPLWTLPSVIDSYRDVEIDPPVCSEWSRRWYEDPPNKWQSYFPNHSMRNADKIRIRNVRRAFYSMITHVDRQIRVILGMLRETGLIENTIIAFTSDHGDMLGDHGLWAKTVFYEGSARIPLIIVPPKSLNYDRRGGRDDRLAEIRDLMPTLLTLAGLPVPNSVEGTSLFSDFRREYLYGEHGEEYRASRMIRRDNLKLIYYPDGNRFQLFDLSSDHSEASDLISDERYRESRDQLKALLKNEIYGRDSEWLKDGDWVGLPPAHNQASLPDFGFGAQRGVRFP